MLDSAQAIKEVELDYFSNHKTTFLTSIFNPPPADFFQGYCFSGSDFIFGQEGAGKYKDATGNVIRGGLDGCYIVVRRHGTAYHFDTDYAGYKVLYYYHDGELWCVSNSIAKIVDFLRENAVRVSPNYPHLAGILGEGSGSSQLFSFETIVHGVKMAPRATTLVVTPHGVSFERWPAPEGQGYENGLSEHLNTWVSRYETLMLSPYTDFTIDVTGGVDSRTNFALALSANRRLGSTGSQPRLNCGSTPTDSSDLDVARTLTDQFGMELNDRRRFLGYPLTPEESYQTFRDLNVGSYYPLYMPTEGPSPTKIQIGGGGGEIHRRFYENHLGSKDPERFYNNYAGRINPPGFRAEFIRDARTALRIATPAGVDPLRAHYREFRHRFHVGRSPRYAVNFTPLDSVSADMAQANAGAKRLDEGQFNYDVLYSLEPELLEMPFDAASKAPTQSVGDRLARVEVRPEASPGEVWLPEAASARNVVRSKEARIEVYRSAFEEALANPFVTQFWGESHIAVAKELMDELVAGRSIGNAVNGKPISAVFAAHLATPA